MAENWKLQENQKEQSFGPLWKYICQDDITDIEYTAGNLWIKRINSISQKVNDEEITEQFMKDFAIRVGNHVGKNFNPVNNTICADTDTLRITCVYDSMALSGLVVNIRKSLPKLRFNRKQAIEQGYASEEILAMLINCVLAKRNFVFCGEPGKGKTECGKFLSSYIKSHEKVITIEDVCEWHYGQINPGKSHIEIKVDDDDYAKVLSTALRLNPSWLVFAETRSREVRYLLESWSNGVSSLTTLHTNDARHIPDRILNMLESRQDSDRIVNQIYNDVGIGVLLDEEIGKNNQFKRDIKQVCFYWREDGVNKQALVVDNGILIKERIPSHIKEDVERRNHRDLFTLSQEIIDEEERE